MQCSRFRQLGRLTHVYHAQPARHAQPTHRWLAMKSQSDSTWYTRLCGAAAVAQLRTRPPSSAHTQGDSDHRDELQKEAIICCKRDRIARLARYRTHMPPAAAFQAQSCGCQLRACIPCVNYNEHAACGLSSPHKSAGRGHSALESRVSVWTRGYRPKWASFDGCFLHTRQAHTIMRAVTA